MSYLRDTTAPLKYGKDESPMMESAELIATGERLMSELGHLNTYYRLSDKRGMRRDDWYGTLQIFCSDCHAGLIVNALSDGGENHHGGAADYANMTCAEIKANCPWAIQPAGAR